MRAAIVLAAALLIAASSSRAAECQPQKELDVSAIKPQVILVGEIHGSQQVPEFVGGLVCSLLQAGKPVILALEMDDSQQPWLNSYLKSSGSAADRKALLDQGSWTWPTQDGRSSQAMLALIESLRQMRQGGMPVALLAMQHEVRLDLLASGMPMQDLSSRMNDRFMADKLAGAASNYPEHAVVALAGNLHTATKATERAAPGYQPMGQVLSGLVPIFVIGLRTDEAGTDWLCTGSDNCGPHPVFPQALYVEGTQIDAEVRLGKLSASPPARSARH